MTRAEVQQLLQMRFRLCGHNFNGDVLDTWAEELTDVPYDEAVVAMRRAAARNKHVNWFEFSNELDAHKRGKATRPEREHTHDAPGTWCRCGQYIPTFPEGVRIAYEAYGDEMRDRAGSPETYAQFCTRFGLEVADVGQWGDVA